MLILIATQIDPSLYTLHFIRVSFAMFIVVILLKMLVSKEIEKYYAFRFGFIAHFKCACNVHMKIYCSHSHKIINENKKMWSISTAAAMRTERNRTEQNAHIHCMCECMNNEITLNINVIN